jgi:hypothetical protein
MTGCTRCCEATICASAGALPASTTATVASPRRFHVLIGAILTVSSFRAKDLNNKKPDPVQCR